MSVIEDSRKVLQDFIAPELRAIVVRLDALEKRYEESEHRAEKRHDEVNLKLNELNRQVDKRFDEVNRLAEKRHGELLNAIEKAFEISVIQERLARLESRDSPHQ